MNKKFTLIFFLLTSFVCINFAGATIVIIEAIGTNTATERFSPLVALANCGDTIKWVKVSGTHTTASTTIPPGAASWSSPTLTTSGYTYVATVPGTYNYTCHPNSGGHMDASFEVTCGTGIPKPTALSLSSVYPNPSTGKVAIDIGHASNGIFVLYNMIGEKISESNVVAERSSIDLNVPEGIYFYKLIIDGEVVENERLIIQ